MTYSIDKSTKTKHKMCFLLFGKNVYIHFKLVASKIFGKTKRKKKFGHRYVYSCAGLNLLLIVFYKCLGN